VPVQGCTLPFTLFGDLILHSVADTLVSINSGFILCQLTNGKMDGLSEVHKHIFLQLFAVKASEHGHKDYDSRETYKKPRDYNP
jgi:hypothetical protein